LGCVGQWFGCEGSRLAGWLTWPAGAARKHACADELLTDTGLERSDALAKDIAYMQQQWGLEVPQAAEDGIGHKYAK
jgi:hypothetical protein